MGGYFYSAHGQTGGDAPGLQPAGELAEGAGLWRIAAIAAAGQADFGTEQTRGQSCAEPVVSAPRRDWNVWLQRRRKGIQRCVRADSRPGQSVLDGRRAAFHAFEPAE